VCVCVRVCVREGVRRKFDEFELLCVRERGKERECVWGLEERTMKASGCVCVGERERDGRWY